MGAGFSEKKASGGKQSRTKDQQERRTKGKSSLYAFCESLSEGNLFPSGIEHLHVFRRLPVVSAFLQHTEELLKNSRHASPEHRDARLI